MGVKMGTGVSAREIAAAADENGDIPEPLSQHVGFITRLPEWEEEPVAVADYPELSPDPSAISPTQDDYIHAFLLEQLGDVFYGGGFSGAPEGNVPHADYLTG